MKERIVLELSDKFVCECRERSAREGKNPQTGEKIKIAACKTPAFKAGKAFKDFLN